MKPNVSSFFDADFALVIVLAAMLAIGLAALAAPVGKAAIPAAGAGTLLAAESQPVVHYRIDVIGVRAPHTADGGLREGAAQSRQPG